MADTAPSVPGFFDGLGDRLVVTDRSARALEVLRLRPELVSDPRFEAAVRARVGQLAQFQHAGCNHVRHVGRLPGGDGRLALVSDFVTGWRLSEVLQAAEQLNLALHTNAVLFLLRQLVSVVSDLHAIGSDVSHGALGPERIVVTPTGRLVVTEHVLGSALPFVPSISPQRAWRDLRLAVPADEERLFGQRSDVLQLGLCGLALVLSRPLRLDDYPQRLRDLLDRASESKVTGERRPLRPAMRTWFEHMLGLVPVAAALNVHDAREGLDRLVSREGYLATPTGLVGLLESVEAYFAGELAPAVAVPDAATAAPGAAVAMPHAATEPVHQADAATEVPETVAVRLDPVASPHREETRFTPTVEEPAALQAPARPEHAPPPASPPAAVEPEIVIWQEAATPAPALAAMPAPAADHHAARQVELPHAAEEVAPVVDADALDLAPGPRPAWPSAPQSTSGADSFAPEPGIAFAPDEPAAEEWQDVSPRAPSSGAASAAGPGDRQPAASGRHELPWLRTAPPSEPQETTRVRRPVGETFDVAPPPPVPRPSGAAAVDAADALVEPIASTVDEPKTSGGRSRSGATPRAGSLFGSSHDEEEDVTAVARPSRTRWIAAAAVGCLALAGTLGGWALMGTSAEEPADRTPAAVSGENRAGTGGADPSSHRAAEPSDRPAPAANATAPVPAGATPTEVPAVPTGQLRVIAPFAMEVFESGTEDRNQRRADRSAGGASPAGAGERGTAVPLGRNRGRARIRAGAGAARDPARHREHQRHPVGGGLDRR